MTSRGPDPGEGPQGGVQAPGDLSLDGATSNHRLREVTGPDHRLREGAANGHRLQDGATSRRRSVPFLVVAGTLALLFFAMFVALGTWQLKRRVWKLDLIARVEQRVHAPAVAAPGRARWTQVTAASDEYRHVTVSGTFLDQSQTLVQAVTALGAGYWVLTPLRTADGSIVLVNRGFVSADDHARVQPGSAGSSAGGSAGSSAGAAAGDDMVHITGLLRITERGGAFLRHNDPAANRWYSRDVQAIAQARGLPNVAPYFIDADSSGTRSVLSPPTSAPGAARASGPASGPGAPGSGPASPVAPVGGLTVITFHNSHLVYAITWYTLALMVAGGVWIAIRNETPA